MENKQKDDQLEQKIRHTINETVLESELVSQKMQEAYDKIRKMQKTRKRKVSLVVRFGTVAAVLAVATIYCVKNPAIAAQIPFLGNIFRDLEGQVSFPGDYSEKSIKLGAASEKIDVRNRMRQTTETMPDRPCRWKKQQTALRLLFLKQPATTIPFIWPYW